MKELIEFSLAGSSVTNLISLNAAQWAFESGWVNVTVNCSSYANMTGDRNVIVSFKIKPSQKRFSHLMAFLRYYSSWAHVWKSPPPSIFLSVALLHFLNTFLQSCPEQSHSAREAQSCPRERNTIFQAAREPSGMGCSSSPERRSCPVTNRSRSSR